MNEQFVWSDAWILLAIICSGGHEGQSADLTHIIHAADFIDHAIPTDNELDGALTRLQRVGLVEKDDDRFRASASTIEAYKRTITPRRDVYKELEDIKGPLNIETT